MDSARLVTLVAALSITIVRLPVFIGIRSVLDPIVLLLFILCIGWGASRQSRGAFTNKRALIAFLYAGLIAVALFRGTDNRAYGTTSTAINQGAVYILFVAFGIILITTARNKQERDRRLFAIAMAPAVYVVANAIMNFGGLQSPVASGVSEGHKAVLLQYVGLSSVRTKFPLATSINLFSIVVAATLASVIIMRLRVPTKMPRKIAWSIIAACLYCLLLGDSRGALVVVIVVIVIFAIRIRIPGALVAGIVPLLPLMVIGVTSLLAKTSLDTTLSRSSSQFEEAATATGRIYIWKGSWEVLKHFSVEELYGWGAAGHYTSGASRYYAFVFPGNPEALKIFTHNIALQTIFDTGYIGLALLMLVVGMTWRRLWIYTSQNPRSFAIACLVILLVIILSGATEVSPTYYSQEALLAFLMIAGAATALPLTRKPPVRTYEWQGGENNSRPAVRSAVPA
jgi:O-antigen ligase